MDLSTDEIAERIEGALGAGETIMVLLHEYKVGDNYDIPCIASALTISNQHIADLRRDGDQMRGTAFFPLELTPQAYRDRVAPSGVVPIGIEFKLSDIVRVVPLDT